MNRQNNNLMMVLIATILIVALLATFALTLPKKMENKRLAKQLQETQERLQALEERLEAISRETEALKRGDPKAIERVARDKFGYSREDEEIYNVEPMQEPQEQ